MLRVSRARAAGCGQVQGGVHAYSQLSGSQSDDPPTGSGPHGDDACSPESLNLPTADDTQPSQGRQLLAGSCAVMVSSAGHRSGGAAAAQGLMPRSMYRVSSRWCRNRTPG